jgi:hypothetical protein
MTAEFPHIDEKDLDAVAVVRRWVEFVNSGDADGVENLYADHAVLLPTFSPHTINTRQQRGDYFRSLASRKGLQVSIHEKTVRIRALSPSIKVASGIYRFCFEVDDEPLTFEARFSYTMDLSKPHPIKQHHSSQVPRTLG